MEFAVPLDHRFQKTENKKADKDLDLARELKIVKHEIDSNTFWSRSALHGTKKWRKQLEELEIRGIIEILQNPMGWHRSLFSIKLVQESLGKIICWREVLFY